MLMQFLLADFYLLEREQLGSQKLNLSVRCVLFVHYLNEHDHYCFDCFRFCYFHINDYCYHFNGYLYGIHCLADYYYFIKNCFIFTPLPNLTPSVFVQIIFFLIIFNFLIRVAFIFVPIHQVTIFLLVFDFFQFRKYYHLTLHTINPCFLQ